MQVRNEEFDRYVNSLNSMIYGESKSRLESFYALHAPLISYFEVIDDIVKALLKKDNLHPDSVSTFVMRITEVLPLLEKMKADISILTHDDFSRTYKQKLVTHIEYIKKSMSVDDVADMSHKLSELLVDNAKALVAEKKELARQEKLAHEMRERQEAECREKQAQIEKEQKEERARKTREEREERMRRERERVRKEKAEEQLKLKQLETDYKLKFRSMADDLSSKLPDIDKGIARAVLTMKVAFVLCLPIITAVIGLPLLYYGYRSKLEHEKKRYAITYTVGLLMNES